MRIRAKVFVYADQKEFDRIRHLLEDGETYTRNVVHDEIFSIHSKYEVK